jgi:hypothetical protein
MCNTLWRFPESLHEVLKLGANVNTFVKLAFAGYWFELFYLEFLLKLLKFRAF